MKICIRNIRINRIFISKVYVQRLNYVAFASIIFAYNYILTLCEFKV